jgi:hypothetical protein
MGMDKDPCALPSGRCSATHQQMHMDGMGDTTRVQLASSEFEVKEAMEES